MTEISKTLVFLTSSFPFGKAETFIENEISFLCGAFDKVIIISNNTSDSQTREIPSNVTLLRRPYNLTRKEKLISFFNLISPLWKEEKEIVKNAYRIKKSAALRNTALQALEKSKKLEHYLLKHLPQELNHSGVLFYSYWADDNAVALALLKAKGYPFRLIYRAHGWDVYFERHQVQYLPFRKLLLRYAESCYAISLNGVEYINTKTDFKFTDKVKLSRLGTINHKGGFGKIGQEKIQLVSCSNLIPLKRVHLIIESLAILSGIKVDWIHFGTGPLQQETETLAKKELNGKNNISYTFAGQKTNAEVLSYYEEKTPDLFINVSETEGLPVSMMEAMSFMIPCIGTNVGGVPEIITNKTNGFMLNADPTPSDIAGAISEYAGSGSIEKQQMRLAARQTWEMKFNAEKNYTEFIASIIR